MVIMRWVGVGGKGRGAERGHGKMGARAAHTDQPSYQLQCVLAVIIPSPSTPTTNPSSTTLSTPTIHRHAPITTIAPPTPTTHGCSWAESPRRRRWPRPLAQHVSTPRKVPPCPGTDVPTSAPPIPPPLSHPSRHPSRHQSLCGGYPRSPLRPTPAPAAAPAPPACPRSSQHVSRPHPQSCRS